MSTNTTTATTKKPRAPRKAKTAEQPATAASPDSAPKAPSASTTVANLTKYAILGCAVIVTLPPAWKFNVPDRKAYYQIEVKDTQGNRYSDTYRITDKDRAKTLAEKIAKDRGIPLKVYEIVDKPEEIAPANPSEDIPLLIPEEDNSDLTNEHLPF